MLVFGHEQSTASVKTNSRVLCASLGYLQSVFLSSSQSLLRASQSLIVASSWSFALGSWIQPSVVLRVISSPLVGEDILTVDGP